MAYLIVTALSGQTKIRIPVYSAETQLWARSTVHDTVHVLVWRSKIRYFFIFSPSVGTLS